MLADVIVALRAAGCVFAEDEAAILIEAAPSRVELGGLVARRVQGEPLELIVGWAEFCGLRIAVEPMVFVPRRRTELLAREAAVLASEGAVVLDLCCGTGAVGAAIAALVGRIELFATDVESPAVRCARGNLEAIGGMVFEGDLYTALPSFLRGRVDVIAVNAPYVPSGEVRFMPAEARLFEPLVTLDGGADGLDVQRRVASEATQWLAPGASVLIETSERQASTTAKLLESAGLRTSVVIDDDLDATVVIGRFNP
jgi:release factor glutamine methyltransferase